MNMLSTFTLSADVLSAMSSSERTALSRRFGDNLRALRQARGLSQEAFADLAGVHRTFVGHLERGQNQPTLDTIVRFATALEVPLMDLLDGIGPQPPTTSRETT